MWKKNYTGVLLGLFGGTIFGLLANYKLNLTKFELIVSFILLTVAIYFIYVFDGEN
jgi:hypothetical protein